MSGIEDLCNNVRSFSNIQYDDPTIQGWVKFAEERFNSELRDVTMQSVAVYIVPNADSSITMPADWLETRWVRFAPGEFSTEFSNEFDTVATPQQNFSFPGYPDGFIGTSAFANAMSTGQCKPLRPCSPDEYFSLINDPVDVSRFAALYMVHGGVMHIFPTLATGGIEIGYYAKVPSLLKADNALWADDTRLYTYATLAAGMVYEKDSDRSTMVEMLATARIQARNESTRKGIYGAGPLHMRRTRSFG